MGILSQLFGPPVEIRKSRSLEEMLQVRPTVFPAPTLDEFETMLRRVFGEFSARQTVTVPSQIVGPSVTKSAPAKRRLKLCPVCHEKPLTGKQRTCSDRCRQAQSRAKRAKPKARTKRAQG